MNIPIEQWSPQRFKRDPEHECDGFEQGKKDDGGQIIIPLFIFPECITDGHYMCDECIHARRCNCGAVWDDGGCRKGCDIEDIKNGEG